MKRQVWAAWWSAWFTCTAWAATGAGVTEDARPLFLWEVSKKGQVSHVLGTCHSPIPLKHALGEHDALLGDARVVLHEIDLAGVDSAEMISLAWRSDGSTLSDELDPGAFHELARRARDVAPAPMLNRMKPWVVYGAAMLTQTGWERADGQPLEALLDQAVSDAAAAEETPQVYLETTEEQIARMEGVAGEIFVQALSELATLSQDELNRARASLLDACVSADLDAVAALLDTPGLGLHRGDVYAARNKVWMPRLLEELGEGDALVAVGVGGLPGRTGLLNQLKRRGYKVRAMTTTQPPAEGLPTVAAGTANPEVDEARVELWTDRLGERFPAAACAENTSVRRCAQPDEATCVARVAADLALCIDQFGAELPEGAATLPEAFLGKLGVCALSGLLGEGQQSGDLGPDCAAPDVGAASPHAASAETSPAVDSGADAGTSEP